jgi:ribosomal protein S18 acetylase RimI-like enzyme
VVRIDLPLAAPVLRPVTPEDEPFLRALYRATRGPELAALPWSDAQVAAFCNMQFDAQAAGYRSAFPRAEHLLICGTEAPAGRMIKSSAGKGLVLVDIALMPAFRNRGWGSLLLRSLQDEARARAVPLRLQVEKASSALAFYLRLGFTITGEQGLHFTMSWTPLP